MHQDYSLSKIIKLKEIFLFTITKFLVFSSYDVPILLLYFYQISDILEDCSNISAILADYSNISAKSSDVWETETRKADCYERPPKSTSWIWHKNSKIELFPHIDLCAS